MEELYMRRAMELATLGAGAVSPNPMVGCVIVHGQKVIGEGWHRKYGGPHAEVNAIENVADREMLRASEAYVSLEPCAHHGKTPPCSQLLVSSGIKKVYVSNTDPNPLVRGKGIDIMRRGGIEVETDVLSQEGSQLNKRFFTYHMEQRPYVILKWAQTADGYIARRNRDSRWISNEWSRTWVHKWRSEEDAILVGKHTALQDDPQLGVRDWSGKDPIRIVLDRHLELPRRLKLFDRSIPTLCYNYHKSKKEENLEYIMMDRQQPLAHLMRDLWERKILSLLVEGGTAILNAFIQAGVWDEARVFTAASTFGEGLQAPVIIDGRLIEKREIMGDCLRTFYRDTADG